jgi:hypothetical protein
LSQFIKGTYVFKQNNIEIGRTNNLITSNGRNLILEFLAGARQNWAADMAIGAMSSPSPLVSDTQLNFETARYPVVLKSYITANTVANNPDLISIRTTLPINLSANIYEIGLYAINNAEYTTSTRNNIILNDFSDITNWTYSAGTVSLNQYIAQGYSSPRIGSYSINLSNSTTYSNSSLSIGFSNYTNKDYLQLLVFNTTSGTITVTLTDISGITQTLVFTTTLNTGYSVLSSEFDSGIYNFSNITSISITTDSNTYATIDAIKVSSANEISVEESLVSKAVLLNPIAKNLNVSLDVEYYVEML